MDRTTFYYRQKVLEEDLNDPFDSVEQATLDYAIDTDASARTPPEEKENFGGIVVGLEPDDLGWPLISIDAGVSYDELGRRTATTTSLTLNLTNDGRTTTGTAGLADGDPIAPTEGYERWITVFLCYEKLNSERRYDGYNAPIWKVNEESFYFEIIAGSEMLTGTLPMDPDGTAADRQANKTLLCDVHVRTTSGTTVIRGIHKVSPGEIPGDYGEGDRRTEFYFNYFGTTIPIKYKRNIRDVLETLADNFDLHLGGDPDYRHAASVVTFTPGSSPIWADDVGGAYGLATTVDAALKGIVDDLNSKTLSGSGSPSGAAKIGIAYTTGSTLLATAAAAYELPSDSTLQAALEAIKDRLNGLVFRGGDEEIAGTLAPNAHGLNLGISTKRWDAYLHALNCDLDAADPHGEAVITGGTLDCSYDDDAAIKGTSLYLGVKGITTSGTGVQGTATSGTGVYGTSEDGSAISGLSDNATGVNGSSNGTTSAAVGVAGTANDTLGKGVYGYSTSGLGVLGGSSSGTGVKGESTSGTGVKGNSVNSYGIEAFSDNSAGIYGSSGATASGIGIHGVATGTSSVGVQGTSNETGSTGVLGESSGGMGVKGTNAVSSIAAVHGESTASTFGRGVQGSALASEGGIGVYGLADGDSEDGVGVKGRGDGTDSTGVIGIAGHATAIGVQGTDFEHYDKQRIVLAVPMAQGVSNPSHWAYDAALGLWYNTGSVTSAAVDFIINDVPSNAKVISIAIAYVNTDTNSIEFGVTRSTTSFTAMSPALAGGSETAAALFSTTQLLPTAGDPAAAWIYLNPNQNQSISRFRQDGTPLYYAQTLTFWFTGSATATASEHKIYGIWYVVEFYSVSPYHSSFQSRVTP